MKIDYPYVFRDGGGVLDSEKNARLLDSAFVRFLLSAGTAYFTFWDNDDRVTLSDSESALIDRGLADLSRDASMKITRIILSSDTYSAGTGSLGFTKPATQRPGETGQELVNIAGYTLVFVSEPGFYLFQLTIRTNANSVQQTGNFAIKLNDADIESGYLFKPPYLGQTDVRISAAVWVDTTTPISVGYSLSQSQVFGMGASGMRITKLQ